MDDLKMLTFIRHSFIKYVTPIIWKLFPAQKINALQKFSMIEKDSGCQLYWCIDLVKEQQIKAELFQHVLEEFCHADLFEDLGKHYSDTYLNTPVMPREYYVKPTSSMKEILDFYSYAFVGESEVNSDFMVLGEAKVDKKISSLFTRIGADEERHVVGTDEILLKLCDGNKSHYDFLILKSKAIRFYKQFTTYSRNFGQYPLSVLLTIIYFVFGPFIFFLIRKRLEMNFDEQFEIFKEQLREQELEVKK